MTVVISRRTVLAAGTSTLIAGPALAQAPVQGVTATEIVLGSHLDLSGPVAADMPKLRAGMQMRLDEANAAGGINGRKFRLIVEDNGSQPQMAVRAVTKLVQQDQVFAIINAFGSGPNAATIKRAIDANVMVFAPWGASAVFRKISGNSPLLITTVPNYDGAMATGLTWALETFKSSKVGYIYQEGPFGELIGAGVKKALGAKTLATVAEASYKPGDLDFSSHVARMKAAGADLIVAATLTRETVGIIAEAKKIGWSDIKVLTATPGRTSNVTRLGGAAIDGLYGVGSWTVPSADDARPLVKSFFANLKSQHNFDPDENAMLAYAYTDIFVRAVEAAGKDLTPQVVATAMAGIKSSHPIFYDEKSFTGGHLVPETVRVEQAKGGTWVPVSGLLI